jgi:DNA-binding NtrC family response regulator
MRANKPAPAWRPWPCSIPGEEFELMLSDLMMADLDGIGLLERTKEKFPDMPVVMVTAVHDISVALAAIRNGAYDYLLKPVRAGTTAQRGGAVA